MTLGVGEPFTATVRVAAYAALLISMPVLLFQAYAFLLPAFSPRERQVALPLMLMVPFLFLGGVVFAYFLVLPAAVNFLQNFNDDNYDILLQARDYYKFAVMLLGVMGLLFQLPIGILAVTRMGIVSTRQLRANRRYAILVIAVLAMLLPGTDPVTMLMMMAPLLVLYEVSILLATVLDRRAERARAREEAEADADDDERLTPHPDHALRPQRLGPPPRRQGRLRDARPPHGRRARALRHRRRRVRRPRRRDHGAQSGSTDDTTKRLEERERAATRRAQADPENAALWAAVARARFNLAGVGDNLDQETGAYTATGQRWLRSAGDAWERHLEVADKPDDRVASLMVQAYGALGDGVKAVRAQEVVAEARNSAGTYATLAQLAYQAGQTRTGDLAADKALDLTEPDMRESLRGQLDAFKPQATPDAAGGGGSGSGDAQGSGSGG